MVVVEASGTAARRLERRPRPAQGDSAPTSRPASSPSLADAAGADAARPAVEGEDTDHVLEAIFKALGVALADAHAAVTPTEG